MSYDPDDDWQSNRRYTKKRSAARIGDNIGMIAVAVILALPVIWLLMFLAD